jgi:hypothetical protein
VAICSTNDAILKVWLPATVARFFIEIEMREQFNEMRNEIIKRKRAPLLRHHPKTLLSEFNSAFLLVEQEK